MTLLGPADRTEVLAHWMEPARAYHGERHLQECLRLFEQVRHVAHDADAVEAALWLHDVIYDPQRDDNERRSAEFARALLTRAGVAPARIAAIEAMILATTHDRLAATHDEQLVCDIDLAILAAGDERFAEYEREIRAEYAWVPLSTYREKRRDVLTRFLSRPHLYQTAHFGARLEWKARINLARALDLLQGDTPGA